MSIRQSSVTSALSGENHTLPIMSLETKGMSVCHLYLRDKMVKSIKFWCPAALSNVARHFSSQHRQA